MDDNQHSLKVLSFFFTNIAGHPYGEELGWIKPLSSNSCNCIFSSANSLNSINWWLFSDHTITQGHNWVKHHMFDHMSLLVDQVDFRNSFNNSSDLNADSNRKTCNKFWIQNSNSNLKLYFTSWTWAHTLHLALVYNTVIHLKLRKA
jgi:hypothetical protein